MILHIASEDSASNYPLRPVHRTTGREIMLEFAQRYSLRVADLVGRSRVRKLAHIRQACMSDMRERTKLSSTQIGLLLGGRDHGTVLYGVKAHKARIGVP